MSADERFFCTCTYALSGHLEVLAAIHDHPPVIEISPCLQHIPTHGATTSRTASHQNFVHPLLSAILCYPVQNNKRIRPYHAPRVSVPAISGNSQVVPVEA